MGAIYDAESLAMNATEGFQAGLCAPASQTSWLSASSPLFANERDRGRVVPHLSAGTEGDILVTGNRDFLIIRFYFKSLSSIQNTTPLQSI